VKVYTCTFMDLPNLELIQKSCPVQQSTDRKKEVYALQIYNITLITDVFEPNFKIKKKCTHKTQNEIIAVSAAFAYFMDAIF